MVEWHHRLNGHEFEQALGDGEGQGSLVCSSPWGHKEAERQTRLNNWSFHPVDLPTQTTLQLQGDNYDGEIP